MANITITIPVALANALRESAEKHSTSIDSLVVAALTEYFQSSQHRLYQISTAGALVEGVYNGAVSSRQLLEHGDFGLGTFEGLDGEMVVLDGAIYQVHGNGEVLRRQDDFRIPFAAVTRFHKDEEFETNAIASLKDLETICDRRRESDNLFYALRMDGVFERMHTRAVVAVPAGTRLVDAAKKQPEFHFENVDGTLVCIWSPTYSRSLNVQGYHFHFISRDRTKGGHVLDCKSQALRVGIQMLCEYDVSLPTQGSFLTTDLSRDPTSDLNKTE